MENKKTYYKILKEDLKVLDYVQYYKQDFLKHDRKLLRGFKGGFVYGIRESGTDLFKIEDIKSLEDIKSIKIWLLTNNKRFFYGKNNTIKEVSKEDIGYILENALININIEAEKNLLKSSFNNDLKVFHKNNIRELQYKIMEGV